MTKNILLTSMDALENDRPLRYYGVQKEFGFAYCEAMQSMEASTKYILASFPIDEILVIGDEMPADSGDTGKPFRLKDAGALSSAKPGSLSAFDLYRFRIAEYINETSHEQQAYDALLPEEERQKLIDFIRTFQEQYSEREIKRINRLFDEFACSRQLYERFRDALFAAFPEARKDSRLAIKWVNNYLYEQLKPSAKLEILPANENICARYFPADMLEKREYWFNSALDVNQDVLDGKDEINLFVSLANDSAVDAHIVLNMLDILISTPGSNVHLKKIYRVLESSGSLAGVIEDNTVAARTTDLVAAAHAFLNYSKTDMLVNFWENSGQHDERISRLIYAARHVDVGISMCNIIEVQEGIQMLRSLCRDERSWTEDGDYGLLFGVIGGCIQADYGALLESDSISFIELIKWAYKHQLYQQVLTLIESHAPANLVNTGVFYYCDDEKRKDEVVNLLAQQRLLLKPYEYYRMDDIDHYFIKNYDRAGVRLNGSRGEDRNAVYAALRAKSIENQDPAKISGHTACGSMETVQNVLYAYFHLGEVRNKISHADSDAMAERRLNVSENEISYAMVMMRESIEFFIKSYETAIEEVRDKNPKIVAITADDVRNAADRMRRERGHDERNQPFRRQE
ncbi:MAG: hypothetical protein IK099_00530 [Clostridia bacterium]|nr:hypothetical protein [Clostridia bacterium]